MLTARRGTFGGQILPYGIYFYYCSPQHGPQDGVMLNDSRVCGALNGTSVMALRRAGFMIPAN